MRVRPVLVRRESSNRYDPVRWLDAELLPSCCQPLHAKLTWSSGNLSCRRLRESVRFCGCLELGRVVVMQLVTLKGRRPRPLCPEADPVGGWDCGSSTDQYSAWALPLSAGAWWLLRMVDLWAMGRVVLLVALATLRGSGCSTPPGVVQTGGVGAGLGDA